MQAIVISVGDELALGQTVDTNSAWLASQLAGMGFFTHRHITIADDRPAIARAIADASREAQVVLVTGGLGPTDDDLTREALADAMGVELALDEAALATIEAFFARRDKLMPQRNSVQAMCPIGASLLPNANGTAPGIRASLNSAEVFVMPGVPREMFAMYERHVEPAIRHHAGTSDTILTTKLNTFGIGESDMAQRLGPLMARDRNPKVGTTVSNGFCSARIRSESADPRKAQAELESTVEQVQRELGPLVFSRNEGSLQEAVVTLFTQQGKTIATAESCTGGLIGAMLTDVPGSSAVYRGGWVTYSNTMKHQQLGVPMEVLEQHGAVSEAVVRFMAEQARQRADADYAASISGVAGPDGGTPDKPVGTVWIGLATPSGTSVHLAKLIGNRDSIRDRSAKCALQMLRFALLDVPMSEIQWLAR